jgi:hypothetical protein
LDHVIVLEAADEVLLRRLEARPKSHHFKGLRAAEALEAVSRERALYESVLAELARFGGPQPVRFDTNRLTPTEMVTQTLGCMRVG